VSEHFNVRLPDACLVCGGPLTGIRIEKDEDLSVFGNTPHTVQTTVVPRVFLLPCWHEIPIDRIETVITT
jgi:hypothetical protein